MARAEAIVAVTGESQSTSTPASELSVVVHALRDQEMLGATASDLATIVESLTLGEGPVTPRHNTNIKAIPSSRVKVTLPAESSESVEKGDSFRNNQNNVLSSASAEASSSSSGASPLVRISGLFVGGEGGTTSGDGEKRKKAESGGKKEVAVAGGCGGAMSVSVPNLTTSTTSGSEPTTAASTAFAAMARRRTLAGHAASAAAQACNSPSPSPSPAPSPAGSSSFFPRGPSSVSSLVRLALSSNFPGQFTHSPITCVPPHSHQPMLCGCWCCKLNIYL